ncbi:MAG TPA: efflux RND transporter periplasmic adaptor subunit [Chitinivibrionales bacterium]|nr:efflux RND transporter periplasmic adaptor subunit [Chitinivibrionales bacterium]
MKKRIVAIACLCGAISLSCLAGCGTMEDLGKKKGATQAAAGKIKLDVTVGTAVRQTLNQERKLLGTLAAYRETDLAPLSMGAATRVRYLPVKIGDYVKQGQIVAKMDDAQFVSTDAQFQSVKSNYERTKALYESNAVSKSQFEQAEAAYASMKRQLENQEENTVLKAPFSGIVTAKAVEEGELFSTPMTPGTSKGLLRISQLDPLKIDLDVDDQTIQYVKKGMQVLLTFDKTTDSIPVYGKVEWVNPVANSMSRTFGVRIIVPNPERKILPGYFAEAHILMGKKENCLTVPREAVVEDRVFVMKDNIAVAKKVETGMINDDLAEITSGISDGDVVVVTGNKALPDSAAVNVVRK